MIAAQRKDGGEYYCEAIFADTNETVSSKSHMLEIQGIELLHSLYYGQINSALAIVYNHVIWKCFERYTIRLRLALIDSTHRMIVYYSLRWKTLKDL